MARDSGRFNSSTSLIHTCHMRCAFAKGGMAPQTPNRKGAQATRLAFEKLRAGKECQTKNRHDGT
jgi:malate synthase